MTAGPPALSLSEPLLAVLDGLSDGHSLYVPDRNADGHVVRMLGIYINPAGCRLRMTTREQFVGSDMVERYRAQGNDAAVEEYARVLDTGEPMSRVLITDRVAGPKRTFEVNGSCVQLDGHEVFSLSFRDVTHELHSRNRMRTAVKLSNELSRTDELTRLLNRRGWQYALSPALLGAGPLCLAILDLDHFKAFNDAHGHQAGDRLLTDMAGAWLALIPAGVRLARLGGEEFGVLMPGMSVAQATPLVESLRIAVPADQTASAGVAQRQPGETGSDLMGRADESLYVAKRGGRDRIGVA